MADTSENYVPDEAIVFLTVVVVLLVLVVMFFLYLSKALCFRNCGGCPCMEEGKKPREKKQDLEGSYGYDEDESSSDSDDEMLLKYQQSLSIGRLSRQPSVSGYKKKSVAAASRAPSESSNFKSVRNKSSALMYAPDVFTY